MFVMDGMTQSDDIEMSKIFKALSDPNRLSILKMLSESELCACKILESFDITQPTLSHHMRVLSELDLVSVRQDGKWSYYSLNPKSLDRISEYIHQLIGN